MTAGQRGHRPRRLGVVAAALVATLAVGAAGCGPESYEPEPKQWEGSGEDPEPAAQAPEQGAGDGGSDEGDGGESSSGDSEGIDVCAALDAATVQEAFAASEEPSAEVGGESPVATGLGMQTCEYTWPEDNLTVGMVTRPSEEGAEAFMAEQIAATGLTGDPVEGLGDASLLDTSGEVAPGAVAVGVSETAEGVGVVLMLGPAEADPSAYATIGQPLLEQLE